MVPGNPGDEEETETAAKATTVAAATTKVAVVMEVVFRLILLPILVGFYCKLL
jgi:hypothetical protein